MKKFKLTIICDDEYVAEGLHDLATDIECGSKDVLDYSQEKGSHYIVGEVVELNTL